MIRPQTQASPSPSPPSTIRTKNERQLYRHTNAHIECSKQQQQQQQQQHAEWTMVDDQTQQAQHSFEFESPLLAAPPAESAAATATAANDAQLPSPSEAQLAQHIRSRLARKAVEDADATAAARPAERSGCDVTADVLHTAPQRPHSKEKECTVGFTSLDSNQQVALQAEIERLQAQLQSARAAAAAAAAGSVTATPTATVATAKGVVAPAGWTSPRGVQRVSSARERVRQRELNLRQHISSTARFYALLVLHTLLAQLSSAKGTALVRAAMALPGVRDLTLLLSDLGVSIAEWALQSPWFLMLPCAGWAGETLRNPALERVWMGVPEWPLEQVKPWTEGPLRPLFALIAALPLSSLVFELRPLPDEEAMADAVLDGPLAAALKRGEAVPVLNNPAAALSLKAIAVAAERVSCSEAALLSPEARAASGAAAAATGAPQMQPLLRDLFARVEAQQALIALLQQDRAQLHSAISRLEALVLQQSQQAEQDAADAQSEETGVPASGLRHRRGPSSSAATRRAAEPQPQGEDASLHSGACDQARQEQLLRSMREEMDALRERIWQLEQESLVTRRHQQAKPATKTATSTC